MEFVKDMVNIEGTARVEGKGLSILLPYKWWNVLEYGHGRQPKKL